jgi:hypothetical protein
MLFGSVEWGCALRRTASRFSVTRRYLSASLRLSLGLAIGIAWAMSGQSARAANPFVDPAASRQAREDAAKQIPYDKLDANEQRAVSAVVSNPSIFRRLPTQVIDCDPEMHLFLIKHPEVIVNIWSVMGVSKVALERTGAETFRASDGAGTVGRIKFCYSTHDTHVIYGEGTYEGPMFNRPLNARCVLLLKTSGLQETNGRYYVTNRLDAFIQIDHVGVEFIAKSFQPLVAKSADYNFAETSAFLANVSRTAEVNPPGMLRLAEKLTTVAAPVREEFAQVTIAVSERSAGRPAPQPAGGRFSMAKPNAGQPRTSE